MGSKRLKWTCIPVVLSLLLLTAVGGSWSALQQQSAPASSQNKETENRERYQRATDVLTALELSKGGSAADVGARGGYYVQRMADLVGPTGKVFAEDIADDAIDSIRQRVKTFNLQNVEIVKGAVDNPALPADALNAVLIVNSYHHFTQYHPMLEQIFRTLKPGGRLVKADYSLPAHRTKSRDDQIKIH